MRRIFLLIVVIDQITKAIFADRDFSFFGLELHPLRNFGLVFGWDFGARWNLFLLVLVYVAASWLVYSIPGLNKWMRAGKALFLAGAVSNLADRVVYGYVRDFIDLRLGFVFNVADICVVAGLLAMLIFGNRKAISGKPSAD